MSDRYMVIHPDTLEAMRRAGHVAKLEVRIKQLEAAATGLWNLLDEIDTISDLAKDNNEFYRKLVEKVQRRRFQFGKTDGYDVVFRAALAEEKKGD